MTPVPVTLWFWSPGCQGQPKCCRLSPNVSADIKAPWNGMSYCHLLVPQQFNKERAWGGACFWHRLAHKLATTSSLRSLTKRVFSVDEGPISSAGDKGGRDGRTALSVVS